MYLLKLTLMICFYLSISCIMYIFLDDNSDGYDYDDEYENKLYHKMKALFGDENSK